MVYFFNILQSKYTVIYLKLRRPSNLVIVDSIIFCNLFFTLSLPGICDTVTFDPGFKPGSSLKHKVLRFVGQKQKITLTLTWLTLVLLVMFICRYVVEEESDKSNKDTKKIKPIIYNIGSAESDKYSRPIGIHKAEQKILSFPVFFQDFCWWVGRKKIFIQKNFSKGYRNWSNTQVLYQIEKPQNSM